MSNINKNLHLTLQERQIIQTGIENGSTKVAITTTIGKDKSTIGKEIKAHRQLSHRCLYTTDCIYFKKCSHNHICQNCDDYRPFKCSRRDRSPGACNGCNKYQSCRYDKFRYSAANAQKEYEYMLVDSRIGINMTYLELKAIANTVIPLSKPDNLLTRLLLIILNWEFQKKLFTIILNKESLENLVFWISTLD